MKAERLQEYNLLNNDVNKCFHQLFFYISYLKAVNDDQKPMYNYYKDNLLTIDRAYTSIKIQFDNLETTHIAQETQIRQLSDNLKILEQRSKAQQGQIFALSKDLNDVQYDNLIISNDRRKLDEEVRRQANELNIVK